MEVNKANYRITDSSDDIQLDRVEQLLKTSYWAADRDLQTIKRSIENSVCFSLFDGEKQIGFARVVTDFASVAYLADVIIDEEYRGDGLGLWLVDTVVNDSRWKKLFQLLVTDDAHTLYAKFGFNGSYKLMSTEV